MTELNTCAEMRDAMLDAEVDELRGIGETPLARHVTSCALCRAHAHKLLRGYVKLEAGLAAMSTQTAHPHVLPVHSKQWRWIPLPLAAAAVLALVIAQRQDEALPNVDALGRMIAREAPLVSPPAGQQAMVMEKNEMTIVWLYKETP